MALVGVMVCDWCAVAVWVIVVLVVCRSLGGASCKTVVGLCIPPGIRVLVRAINRTSCYCYKYGNCGVCLALVGVLACDSYAAAVWVIVVPAVCKSLGGASCKTVVGLCILLGGGRLVRSIGRTSYCCYM